MDNEVQFTIVEKVAIPLVQDLAHEIWSASYVSIISNEQILYMLEKMYHYTTIESQIKSKENWYFIEYKNEKIGFLHFFPKEDKMYLSKIYIKESFHSLGIGKKGLDFVIENTKKIGFTTVFLRVNKLNHKAIKSYTNRGFKIINEDILEIGNRYIMDDYILEYSIEK